MLRVHAEMSTQKAANLLSKSRQGTAKVKGRLADERRAMEYMNAREIRQSGNRLQKFRGQSAGQAR